MEKLYDIMLSKNSYCTKDKAKRSTGAIKNTILDNPQKKTIEEIMELSVSGYPIIFGYLERTDSRDTSGAGKKHWKRQQVYAIDFDNKDINGPFSSPQYMTWKQAAARCIANRISPAFIYTTGSHTEQHQHFRIVFVLNEVIETPEKHKQIIQAFQRLFTIDNTCVIDTSCSDPGRIFYSGKEIVLRHPESVVDASELLNTHIESSAVKKSAHRQNHDDESDEQSWNLSNEAMDLIQTINDEVKLLQNGSKMTGERLRALMVAGLEQYPPYAEHKSIHKDLCSAKAQHPLKPVTVRHPEDFYIILKQIPMHQLFGYELGEQICCILPWHHDKTPSARFEKTSDDLYVYHCYSCDQARDILDLLEVLTNASHFQLKTIFSKALNLKIETEWQRHCKNEYIDYQDYLMTPAFEFDYPALYKRLKQVNCLGVLDIMIQLARMYVYDHDVVGTDKPMFYTHLSEILRVYNDRDRNKSRTTLHNNIKYLCRLGLIENVLEEDLPDKFKVVLNMRKAGYKRRYRMNCYHIPFMTPTVFEIAEGIIEAEKEMQIRNRSYCREAEVRARGKAFADKLYVQDTDRELSETVEVFYKRYKAATLKLMDKKQWTTEQEILNRLKGFSKQEKEKYSCICLPQLLQELDLKRVPFTKQIEADLQIAAKKKLYYGASKVIIRT